MPAHNRKKGRLARPPSTRNIGFIVGGNDVDLMFSARLQAAANPRQVQSYSSRHNILIVGDGDLTFSLSLASALGGTNLVATTFDIRRELYKKYEGVKTTIQQIEKAGGTVLHGVDATALDDTEELSKGRKFHRIVFNFPHIGGGTQEDVKLNQELLREYFIQCLPRLHPKGEAHVTLRGTIFYESWDVVGQAEMGGMRLARVEKFDTKKLMRYENKRTSGESTMRQAPSIDNAKRYCFTRDPSKKIISSKSSSGGSSSSSNSSSNGSKKKRKSRINVRKGVTLNKLDNKSPLDTKRRKLSQPMETTTTATTVTEPFSETLSTKSTTSTKSEVLDARSIAVTSTTSLPLEQKVIKKKKKKKKARLSLNQRKEDKRVAKQNSFY